MAHHSLTQLFTQFGGKNASMPVDLDRVLRMFQGLRVSTIVGGASGAAVSLPGYVTGDQLIAVIQMSNQGVTAQTFSSVSGYSYAATFAISRVGTSQSGKQHIVVWFDQDKYTYS